MSVNSVMSDIYRTLEADVDAAAVRQSTLSGVQIDLLHLRFPPPSLKTFVGLPIFIIGSGLQHDCHRYLASLKKYSVPKHPAFGRLISPHYFAECLIYVSLAIVTAPVGNVFNWTLLSVLCFVVVNLSITAGTTREWYIAKFGEESVYDKWNIFPLIY